jgi:putative aldouronate transport system permease protein
MENPIKALLPVNSCKTKPLSLRKRKKIVAFDFFNYAFLGLFGIVCILPLIYVVMLSFAAKSDYLNAALLVVPRNFNLECYKAIFFQERVGNAFAISVLVTLVSVVYSMTLTSLGAYVFTKKNVPGLKIIFSFILVTMFFGGGLVPFYLTVLKTTGIDNLFSLFIPFGINTFNMIILRNFFNQVPTSLVESCKLDGAGEFTILFKFVMPLSTAGLATVSLFYLVGKWDDWYWPSILLPSKINLYPLALELRQALNHEAGEGHGTGGWDPTKVFAQGQNAAMIVISLLPIMAIYPFLQKYFVKGVMLGSIKT